MSEITPEWIAEFRQVKEPMVAKLAALQLATDEGESQAVRYITTLLDGFSALCDALESAWQQNNNLGKLLDAAWQQTGNLRKLLESALAERDALKKEVARLNAAVAKLEHRLIRAEGREAVRLAPDGEELATEGLGAEVKGK